VTGVSGSRGKRACADIVDRPALMGAAEIGLRRFIDNPLRFMKQN